MKIFGEIKPRIVSGIRRFWKHFVDLAIFQRYGLAKLEKQNAKALLEYNISQYLANASSKKRLPIEKPCTYMLYEAASIVCNTIIVSEITYSVTYILLHTSPYMREIN